MDFGIAGVAAITVICYLVGLMVKASPWNNDKYIPIACGLVGGVLGAGIVTVRMLMDDKFKTADEIRRYTGLATLAVVPIEEGMVRENRKSKSRRKRR